MKQRVDQSPADALLQICVVRMCFFYDWSVDIDTKAVRCIEAKSTSVFNGSIYENTLRYESMDR